MLGHHLGAALGERQRFLQIGGIGPGHGIDNRVIKGIFDFDLFWFIDPVTGK
jgi:hypothetical protein